MDWSCDGVNGGLVAMTVDRDICAGLCKFESDRFPDVSARPGEQGGVSGE
jgi:hypothetical protein